MVQRYKKKLIANTFLLKFLCQSVSFWVLARFWHSECQKYMNI